VQLNRLIKEYKLARDVYLIDYMETIAMQIAKQIQNYPLFLQKIIWKRTYKKSKQKELNRINFLKSLIR